MKRLTFALILSLFVGSALAQKPTINIGYVLWDSAIASTNVVAAILEDDLGYDVQMTSVDAGPMYVGLASGDFDFATPMWLPVTHAAYWEEYGDQLADMGVNLEGADLGWAVPSYVDVDSMEGLNA